LGRFRLAQSITVTLSHAVTYLSRSRHCGAAGTVTTVTPPLQGCDDVTGASRANPTIRASQFRRNFAIAQTHLRATMPGVIFAVISGIFRYLIWHSLIGRVGEIFIRRIQVSRPITVIIGGRALLMLIAARFSGSGSGKDLLSRAISLIASGLLPFSSFPIPVAPDSYRGRDRPACRIPCARRGMAHRVRPQ